VPQILACLLIVLLSSCSSTHLRKLEDGDLGQRVSQDVAKRFEVKDLEVIPTPTPAPTPMTKVKHHRAKKKKMQEKPSPTPIVIDIPDRRPSVFPFSIGEKLGYDIRYSGFTAGKLEMQVQAEKEIDGRRAYHLFAHANSSTVMNWLYRVNDTVESYLDDIGLFSHRFSMDLDESKQTKKSVELYDYQNKKAYYWARINHVTRGYSEKKEDYDIPLWAQDPLSLLYWIRITELSRDPTKPTKVSFTLDGKLWEMVLTYEKTEKKSYAGHDWQAYAFHVVNYQNGEAKNKDNTIWIAADDPHRYVLCVEAKLKFGSMAAVLDEIHSTP